MEAQEFGPRLRELRKQAGVTQRELAEKVNIDFSYLSKIESGVVPPPSQKVISQLAEALNADKDELIILAGKVPSDIVEILKNHETLQRLRSARAKQMARSAKKRVEPLQVMKQLVSYKSYKSLSKIAIPIVLVIAVAASLWFAAPVRALNISFPSLPSGNLGSTHSFSVKVDITDAELLPIQSVKLEIYNSANPTTYKATCTSLPLTDGGTSSYSNTATGGGGSVSVTASATNWQWLYGYGYAFFEEAGHYFDYGYGYGYGGATASITYTGTWTSPSSWPAGGYKAKVTITANATTFTSTSSTFTLSAAAVEAGGPVRVAPPPASVTYVSDVTTSEGVFTEEVTAESEDGKVELTIDEGTIGLTEKGRRLTKITIAEKEDPPAPPEDSNVIGLTYDLSPDGATFDPSINLTFTYDPALIPADVAEENLVIAVWDEEAGKWVNLVSTVDPVSNTITVRVSHFTAFTIIAYTGPAAFTTTNLIITPDEVDIGDTVPVSALVTNTGDLTDSYKVTLKIDNVVVATKDVTLIGGASQKVTFTITRDTAGTYAVNVNGLSATLVVKAPPVPPVAPPPVPAPAPPVAPPVAPPIPPTAVNWWLIGGIIAAVIIISIAIILIIRRRRV